MLYIDKKYDLKKCLETLHINISYLKKCSRKYDLKNA